MAPANWCVSLLELSVSGGSTVVHLFREIIHITTLTSKYFVSFKYPSLTSEKKSVSNPAPIETIYKNGLFDKVKYQKEKENEAFFLYNINYLNGFYKAHGL